MGDLLIYYLSSICKNLSHIFGRKKNNDYICRVIMKKKLWTHINFIIILVAAILLELAMGVMYYSAYTNIKEFAERYFERETGRGGCKQHGMGDATQPEQTRLDDCTGKKNGGA